MLGSRKYSPQEQTKRPKTSRTFSIISYMVGSASCRCAASNCPWLAESLFPSPWDARFQFTNPLLALLVECRYWPDPRPRSGDRGGCCPCPDRPGSTCCAPEERQ